MKDLQRSNKYLAMPMCAFALFATVICLCMFNMEGDTFWHIKLGEYVLQNHRIMTQDAWSWLSAEIPLTEFEHSWLSDVIIALFANIVPSSPMIGSLLFVGICNFAYFFSLLYVARDEIVHFGNSKILLMLVILLFPIFMLSCSARPQCLTLPLFVWMVSGFIRFADGKSKSILWSFPLITFLWANLHGGAIVLAFAFPVGYFIASLFQFQAGQLYEVRQTKEYRLDLIKMTLAGLSTSLINPSFYKIYVYLLTSNTDADKSYISEWQPLSIRSAPFGVLTIAFFAFLLIISKNKIPLHKLVPCGITMALAVLYIRGIVFFAPCFSLFVAYCLSETRPAPADALPAEKHKCAFDGFLVLLMAAVISTAALSEMDTFHTRAAGNFTLSPAMVTLIKESGVKRMFNAYNIGGYLIYNDIPVFFDSRADLYSGGALEDGMKFDIGASGHADILAKYDFDSVLLRNESPTCEYIEATKEFTLVCRDNHYSFYVKTT